MKRVLLIIGLFLGMFTNIHAACSQCIYTEGTGTANDPWIIKTRADFLHVKEHPDGYFKQANDILMSPTLDVKSKIYWPFWTFNGSYDGNGYQISNLYMQGSNMSLFPKISASGVVKNLTCKDFGFYATQNAIYVATISGENYGLIENCTADINVAGNIGLFVYLGGICTSNYGTVRDSKNIGNLEVYYNTINIGGIVSQNQSSGKIERCYNLGTLDGYTRKAAIEQDHPSVVGGIASGNNGIIQDCYNWGEVKSYERAGGICFDSSKGTIINSYTTGDIYGRKYSSPIGAADANTVIQKGYYLANSIKAGYIYQSGTELTDSYMRSAAFVDELNKGKTEKIWKKTDTYPRLIGKPTVSISPISTHFGDNTKAPINLEINSDDLDIYNILTVSETRTKTVLYKGPITLFSATDLIEGDNKIQVSIGDSTKIVATSNIITVQKNSILNWLIGELATNSPRKVIVLSDVERHYENNSKNQALVKEIKNKAGGVYLIYNNISEVLKPLLRS